MPLFEQQQPHLAQRLVARHRRSLVLARPHQQEILRKTHDLGQRRFGYRQRNDRRIQPAFHDLLDQFWRQRLADVNVEFRMHAREVLDHLRQQIGRDCRDHADAQPSREPVPRGAREVAEFVDRTQDVADTLDDLFAEFCQCHLSCASLQQHAAEGFLHFLDLHRQRRLRDGTRLGRASEMAVTCQRIEVAKLSERHLDHQIILSARS